MYKSLNILLFLLFLIPISVSGTGLGKIRVHSALGERLSAEIELTENSSEEISALTAHVASSEEYAAAGLPDAYIPAGFHIRVVRHADNSRVLEVTSDRPVNEPFVELLIKAESPTVNVLREYTLLLDPPLSHFGEETDSLPKSDNPKIQDQPKSSTHAAAGAADEDVTEFIPSKSRKSSRNQANKVSAIAHTVEKPKKQAANIDVTADSYTTQAGDVFGKVAQRYQPDGVSLKRVMAAFSAANPHAFVNGDMNQLKAAQVLRIPTQESMKGLPPNSAKELAQPAPVASKREANAVAKPDNASPKFVLSISSGDGASTDNKQVDTDSTSPPVEKNPAANNANGAIPPAQEQPTMVDSNAPSANVQQSMPVVASAITALPAPATNKPVVTQGAVNNASFISNLMVHLPWIAFGMAIPLLLILVIFVFNKRRIAAIQEWQHNIFGEKQSPMLVDSPKPSPLPAYAAATGASASENFELYDGNTNSQLSFREDTGMDINEIDPLVEAEIYMSYGRDEQAENILTNALTKTPHRHELTLGLLKIYADRKDIAAFEQIALKIYDFAESGDLDDAVLWGKAAILGWKIDPDNTLYQIEGLAQEQINASQDEPEQMDAQAESLPPQADDFAELPPLEGFESEIQPQAASNQASQAALGGLETQEQSELSELILPDVKRQSIYKSNIIEFTQDDVATPASNRTTHELQSLDELFLAPSKKK